MARVRMSALTMCYLIQHRIGVETILHFTTRDRSLMGLQSELLGAHAVGVRNIIALTGDPPSLGDYPDSSAVYDVDSIGLIRILAAAQRGARLGRGVDRAAGGFTIACAVDPTRADLEHEAGRLRAKLEAGAHVVMTQPIYDPAVWSRFLDVYGVDAAAGAGPGRHPAAAEQPPRRVPAQRGAGHHAERRGARADAPGGAGRPPRGREDGAGAAAGAAVRSCRAST